MQTAETFNNDCLISLVLNCVVGCGWMCVNPPHICHARRVIETLT